MAAKPDWSLLPTELLQLISQKLNSEFYLLRFRSVCSTWRSSIPKCRPNRHLPLKLPKPFSNDDNDSICYLLKHNIFLIKPTTIPISIQHQPQQILQPLLIRIGPNVNGKIHLWHPLNLDKHFPFHFRHKVGVFDFNHISIVDLGQVFVLQPSDPFEIDRYDKVVAATYPGEQQPHIVTYDYFREPCMFRPGDDGWMKIRNGSECPFGDICNFKGRTCLVDKVDEMVETVMVGPDLSDESMAAELLCLGWLRLCVVENELLLVDTTTWDYDASIDVYRLDEKNKKWVELSNLGDRVLFLGKKCSFSASASDLGFAKGNCVINMDASDLGCGICDLNLDENNEMLPLSDYPNYFNLLADSGLDREELHLEKEYDEDEESEDEDDESEDEDDEDSEDEENEEEDDEKK